MKYEPYFDYQSNPPFKVVYTNEEYKLLRDGKIKCNCHCHDYHGVIADQLIHSDWSCRCNTCPCKFLR